MKHSIVAVFITATGYLFYRLIPEINLIKNRLFSNHNENEAIIYLRRIFTAFIYGGLPVLIIIFSGNEFGKYGMKFQKPAFTILSGVITGILLTGINIIHHKRPDNLASFPEIRKKQWDIKTLIYSTITWIIYLLGYEILFRGYMLFSMTEFAGKWPAIMVNIVLYSLVHFHKGWKEAAGAIPLGFVLSFLCLLAGNFWPAFIAHVFLALSNEWLSLKAHPDIRFTSKRTLWQKNYLY